MYQVVYQEQEAVELGVDGSLNREEFGQIVHQLESLSTTFGPINVMFDLTHLEDFDHLITVDEIKFHRENGESLDKVAVVSDSKAASFFTQLFDKISDTDVKHFPASEIENARSWIFVSPLP